MSTATLIKNFITAAAILLVCLPLAFLTTIFTSPLWSWFELKSGIESYGHSGPDEWVYTLVYVILVVICFSIWLPIRKGPKDG